MYCEFNGMIGWSIQLEMILYYFDDSKAQMDRKRGIWTCCLEKMDHGTYKYMQAHLIKTHDQSKFTDNSRNANWKTNNWMILDTYSFVKL